MFKYGKRHIGSNNIHEHVVHAQHVQHQSTSTGVTPAQSFSLGYIYIYICFSHCNTCFTLRQYKSS